MNSVKKFREIKGLSQAQLAKCLDVTQGAISQWETGEAMPQTDKLPKLAEALGCTIDELFDKDATK